ncbi:MAG: hypothetical protein AAGA08_15830 [Pseudomonadota bacterium]
MRPLLFVLPLALIGCGEDGLADQLAREQARNAVNPVLAQRFPGVPLEPATNCVINEASASEILQLAKAGATGVSQTDAELIVQIATRPDTIECLLKDGITPFLI